MEKIKKIWFDRNRIYGLTEDGSEVWQSLLYYKRLLNATEEQRNSYQINAFGIRWEEIDEDISFESFFYPDPEPQGLSKILLSHPEINISALARRCGINQSLMAQYVNGTKRASKEREDLIINMLHTIGKELLSININPIHP
ncbi:MAG: DUF2442 domain-containing protein [Phocaeicola sp.]|nr:DUF2442 domain-containing protein [Phocaeicola sp.]